MGKAAAHVLVRQRHGNSRVDLAQQIQNAIYSRKGGGMPRQAWSKKRERQYLHVKQGLVNRDDSADEAEEIAARTVNKSRARFGESTQASRTSLKDISSGRRGGLRSHKS